MTDDWAVTNWQVVNTTCTDEHVRLRTRIPHIRNVPVCMAHTLNLTGQILLIPGLAAVQFQLIFKSLTLVLR